MTMEDLVNVKRTEVDSSNIKSIGYVEESKILLIEFHSGDIYSYSPITQEGYINLMKAESLGRYFHQNIRNNQAIDTRKIN